MKKLIIFILLAIATLRGFAQKPLIDTSVYGKWQGVGDKSLSNNGAYVYFEIGRNLFIKGIQTKWQKEVPEFNGRVSFADDNRLLITQQGKDSLYIQTLGSDKVETISHVGSFNVSQSSKAEWLVYQKSTPDKVLVIRNLLKGKQKIFSTVTSYIFSPDDRSLILQQQAKGDTTTTLSWLNLANGVVTAFWRGASPGSLTFSPGGAGLAFTTGGDVPGKKAVWYYKEGDAKTQLLFAENSPGIPHNLMIRYFSFNSNGDKLFFYTQTTQTIQKPDPNLASVDIYSYKDRVLQSAQLKHSDASTHYWYIFDFSSHRLIPLEKTNESLILGPDNRQKGNFILTLKNNEGDDYEWDNYAPTHDIYLVSPSHDSRKCLAENVARQVSGSYKLSPNDKYVVYYDATLHSYFSYNIITRTTSNISKGIKTSWLVGSDLPDSACRVDPQYRWSADEKVLFISDQNDIFETDPSGKRPMICLTGGYGRLHHVKFSIAGITGQDEGPISLGRPLLLNVFNELNKDAGFCSVKPWRENEPHLFKIMPYQIADFQKARDAEVYMTELSSEQSFPNLYWTSDLKSYSALTDIQPEKAYNWLTSEIHTWNTPDGKTTQGILYKPENFDPQKKYPVIFLFYEKLSDDLHKFLRPDYPDGEINVPTYVSNGYLVFEPDIHYQVGYAGQSAYNTVVSAAEYLGQFPWVDKVHMGLMGHSFGGFEANYIITHSHLFAAAASLSGVSDFPSVYNSGLWYNGTGNQDFYESLQPRMGATLWQRPDLYIGNSAVFKADQVTTPLLLMANHKDGAVPFQQGLEFYSALRRLGKKTWMLQYDHGGHMAGGNGTETESNADKKDLSIRMRQFFDYYLKGKTPPRWMVNGIPASEKQFDSGLETDTTGNLP